MSSGGYVAAFATLVVIGLALAHPAVALLVVIALVAAGVAWFEVRRRGRARAHAELEEVKRWWRETPFPTGSYVVTLRGIKREDLRLLGFISNLHTFQERTVEDVEALIERARHIGPQVVAESVDEATAIRVKVELEDRGGRVKVSEQVAAGPRGQRREPIPERVRHEVWRRDGGTCVDCGSRERLEFDHIVPYSKGGANTARNLELRCESCNRTKAARI
jgi:hypothetical protein